MPESQNIEWKESWRDEYLKWICGFANAKGGKIIIGNLKACLSFVTVDFIDECKKDDTTTDHNLII
jgi:predicted HTH transcriptional regulator